MIKFKIKSKCELRQIQSPYLVLLRYLDLLKYGISAAEILLRKQVITLINQIVFRIKWHIHKWEECPQTLAAYQKKKEISVIFYIAEWSTWGVGKTNFVKVGGSDTGVFFFLLSFQISPLHLTSLLCSFTPSNLQAILNH